VMKRSSNPRLFEGAPGTAGVQPGQGQVRPPQRPSEAGGRGNLFSR